MQGHLRNRASERACALLLALCWLQPMLALAQPAAAAVEVAPAAAAAPGEDLAARIDQLQRRLARLVL